MKRYEIQKTIGSNLITSNVEKEEFNYSQAFKEIGKDIKQFTNNQISKHHQQIDMRFEGDNLVILVETKNNFNKWNETEIVNQLKSYVYFENNISNKQIICILTEVNGNRTKTWFGNEINLEENNINKIKMSEDNTKNINGIKSFYEYKQLIFSKKNNREKIVESVNELNKLLQNYGIDEKLRSQFVGTCLLALKNNIRYRDLNGKIISSNGEYLSESDQVLKGIRETLTGKINEKVDNENKEKKIEILSSKILESQDIKKLNYEELKIILSFIEKNIIPFINDKNTAGQDLLNLFFTTFNKYVGKADKNQAFTPDHITDFMSKAININKNSVILDPCCGSGAFLVRAMTSALDDADNEDKKRNIKSNQIFGIEYEENAFGLSSTNMLIHGDGNSNIVNDSMFNRGDWIRKSNVNSVLMNPPYNATRKSSDPDYVKTWSKKTNQDPSKGFHFVEWIARHIPRNGKIAVLLPTQAAIGNSAGIREYKEKMLEKYTLDAVFSLPDDIFHPGASAVACCMIFDLSQSHKKSNKKTFFGNFKNDGFEKRKNLGRIEIFDKTGKSLWKKIENDWLELYRNRESSPNLSITKKVDFKDEWLAEAHMESDYSDLSNDDFQQSINDYLAYLLREGDSN